MSRSFVVPAVGAAKEPKRLEEQVAWAAGGSHAPSLMAELEVSHRLGCSVGLLRKWRLFKKGPAYVNVGRLVRYTPASIDKFIEQNQVATSGRR
jgi:hypothetical protein